MANLQSFSSGHGSGFYKTKLALDDPKRMLNFRTDTGFQILGADSDLIDPRVFFECLQRPWLFGDVPVPR